MKEAYLYEKLPQERVRCNLCNHHCIIKEGAKGICGVRENRKGVLYTLVYDKVIASNLDPIEKKPLYHFLPGSTSYSIATVGCNFRCVFCQNSDISQMPRDHGMIMGDRITPEEIVSSSLRLGASSISYTYTEPTVYFELALDCARSATKKGLKNVFVTNGYMSEDSLREIYPDLHGANVDLKSFKDSFYKRECGARVEPVLKNIQLMKEMGIWVEVTTLLIPGLNDSREELRDIARFLKEIDPDIPWHISRFHPQYRLTHIPPTPTSIIHMAKDIGYEEGLRFVYTGNIPGDVGENTFCPECGTLLIERFGFYIKKNLLKEGRCPKCNEKIPGVWKI